MAIPFSKVSRDAFYKCIPRESSDQKLKYSSIKGAYNNQL